MELVVRDVLVAAALLLSVILAADATIVSSCGNPLQFRGRLAGPTRSVFKLSIKPESSNLTHSGQPQYRVDIASDNSFLWFTHAALTVTTTGACGVGTFNYNREEFNVDGPLRCPLYQFQVGKDAEPMTRIPTLIWTPPSCGCVQFRASVLEENTVLYVDPEDTDNGDLTSTVCVHRQTNREKYIEALCKAQAKVSLNDIMNRPSFFKRHNLEARPGSTSVDKLVEEKIEQVAHCCGKTSPRSQSRCMERVRFQRVDAFCQNGQHGLPFTNLRSQRMRRVEKKCCYILGSHRYKCFRLDSQLSVHSAGASILDYSMDELDPLNDLADFADLKDVAILHQLSTAHQGLQMGVSLARLVASQDRALSLVWGSISKEPIEFRGPRASQERFPSRNPSPVRNSQGRRNSQERRKSQGRRNSQGRRSSVREGGVRQVSNGYDLVRQEIPVAPFPGIAGEGRTGGDYIELADPTEMDGDDGGRSSALDDEIKKLERKQRKLRRQKQCCRSGSMAGGDLLHETRIEVIEICFARARSWEAEAEGCLQDHHYIKCCILTNHMGEITSSEVRDHLGMATRSSTAMGGHPNRRAPYVEGGTPEDEQGVGLGEEADTGIVGKDVHDQMDREGEERYQTMRTTKPSAEEDEEEEEDGPMRFDSVDNGGDTTDGPDLREVESDVLYQRGVNRGSMPLETEPDTRRLPDKEGKNELYRNVRKDVDKHGRITGAMDKGKKSPLFTRGGTPGFVQRSGLSSNKPADEEIGDFDDRDFVGEHEDDSEEDKDKEEEGVAQTNASVGRRARQQDAPMVKLRQRTPPTQRAVKPSGDDKSGRPVRARKSGGKSRSPKKSGRKRAGRKSGEARRKSVEARRMSGEARRMSGEARRKAGEARRKSGERRRSRTRTSKRNSKHGGTSKARRGGKSNRKGRRTSSRRRGSRRRNSRVKGQYRHLRRFKPAMPKAHDSLEMRRGTRLYWYNTPVRLDSKEQAETHQQRTRQRATSGYFRFY